MWRALGLACGLLLALPAGAQEGAQESAREELGEQPAVPAPFEAVSVTNVVLLSRVGVPLITPVWELRVRPGGRLKAVKPVGEPEAVI